MPRVLSTLIWAGALALCSTATVAKETDRFVTSNVLSIFYHELGHAMIEIMGLPVFGQEEDAADIASILLIDRLYDEKAAVEIAYDAAFGFLGEAEQAEGEPAWWGVHGPDLQRYYTLVCLFVGADMEGRADIADDLGLPADRLETCEEEFELANASWGPVFDGLAQGAPGSTLKYSSGNSTLTKQVVHDEIAALNDDFILPKILKVSVQNCGEPNAYFDPETVEIVICSEFEGWLRKLAEVE